VLELHAADLERFTFLAPAFREVVEVGARAFAVLNHLSLQQAPWHSA
jgi:hypothetical protein